MTPASEFPFVIRGYPPAEVDALIDRAEAAFNSSDARARAAMSDELRSASFAVRLRGYDRYQVKSFLSALADELDRVG